MSRWSFMLGCALALVGCSSDSEEDALKLKADWAARAFPATVIRQEQLKQMSSTYLLVDTRAAEEYAVSHLPGAINWPDYTSGAVPASIATASAEGRPVVFYCSIGYRSGEATVRAAQLLRPDARVFNLHGGIFQWANEGGELEGGSRVHGFNTEWAQLLSPPLRFLPP